jgi:sugar lactone lactonase YvrE
MENEHTIVELFADQALACGEGPVWDERSQTLFWTDCGDRAIYAKGWTDPAPREVLSGFHAASLVLHEDGGLVWGGQDGFFRWKPGQAPVLIAGAEAPVPAIDINDIIADPAGRVLGGQEAFRENEDYQTGFLFRIDRDGSCTVLEEGLHLSNGMGFSPAHDRFYLVDSILRTVYVYDYNLADGSIRNRKPLVRLDPEDGLPDGMTVDREGFLWVARWFGGGISRYDPDGKLERTLPLPAAQISSLTFGGPDYQDLFVTSAATYWETTLAPPGHVFSTHRGGGVYRLSSPVPGRAEYRAEL